MTSFLESSRRFAATYSIVARDPETGELGVAVQSHYFAVGTTVPWAAAGVGAVATQAFANSAYGPRGLALLRGGKTPSEALQVLLAEDEGRELRQLALVDARGRVAVHTGKANVAAAGHRIGGGFAAQGNMLRSEAVWSAMAAAYEAAAGDLAGRMLAALEAAERAGGDVRGRQSAALLVVAGTENELPWDEKRTDLRVDDHREPVRELGRLLSIRNAMRLFDAAMAAVQRGEIDAALEALAQARQLRPKDPQLQFWTGVVLVHAGRIEPARDALRSAYAADPGWRELLRRLVPTGMIPNDPQLIENLTGNPDGPIPPAG